jgi:nitrogen fixation NifU-like protein
MTGAGDLSRLYRETVLDHCRNPRNCRRIHGTPHHAEGHNPLCGDKVTVYVALDGDRIGDAAFEATGCAISLASASMLTGLVRGRRISEARETIHKAAALFSGKPTAGDLGELTALGGVSAYPSRIRCAMLPWRTLESALGGGAATVSTEDEP